MRVIPWALALLGALAGCEATEAEVEVDPPGYGPGLGTAENPIPRDGVTYAARSRIERASDGVLPEVASVVSTLRAFSAQPADTLLALAADANLPELTQLVDSLSPSLASQLTGWIDAELDAMTLGGTTVRGYADSITAFAETALTQFALNSTMSFTPTRAAHTVTGIEFSFASVNVVVPVGGLAADAIEQEVPVAVAEAGLITFGDHQFGLAFGEHVWHGINLASTTVFGSDVRTSLVGQIDCVQLSQAVASKCADKMCVGHQSELQSVCELSLDLLASDLATRMKAFDSDVVHYVAGTARLVDETGDGLANQIANGVWESELILGPARGTFTAFEGR